MLTFWNYWDYWCSSSPLTSSDLWHYLCDMNDGLEVAGWLCRRREGTLAKVFSDRILSPQAVGTGAVRGTKAFTFYSLSNSHQHLPSSSTNNWSLWQDQSSFSRLTNSGFFLHVLDGHMSSTELSSCTCIYHKLSQSFGRQPVHLKTKQFWTLLDLTIHNLYLDHAT